MPNPKVSVVITTYNRPEFLKKAIQSVLNQNFRDFELVIIDDASPGLETEKTIKEFSDSRIHYIRNQNNKGSTASLNVGLHSASGKYIAILDDDDVWIDENKLDTQVHFLETHPDHVLIGTNIIVVDTKMGKEITRSKGSFDDAQIRSFILSSNPIAHSSVLYLKKAAEEVGGYEETLKRGKDYDLWLKLLQVGKVAVLPEYSVKYREALFDDRDLISMRYMDSNATIRVIWRHRKEFGNYLHPLFANIFRIFIFGILRVFPFPYKIFKGFYTRQSV